MAWIMTWIRNCTIKEYCISNSPNTCPSGFDTNQDHERTKLHISLAKGQHKNSWSLSSSKEEFLVVLTNGGIIVNVISIVRPKFEVCVASFSWYIAHCALSPTPKDSNQSNIWKIVREMKCDTTILFWEFCKCFKSHFGTYITRLIYIIENYSIVSVSRFFFLFSFF